MLVFSFMHFRFERSMAFHCRTVCFRATFQRFCSNRPQNPKTQTLTLALVQPHNHWSDICNATMYCHRHSFRRLRSLAALFSQLSSQQAVDSSPHRCNLCSKLSFLVAGGRNVIYFCSVCCSSFPISPRQAHKEPKQTLRMECSQCW